MKEDRRAILSLVAMGRISAAEAERLIAAWSADREVFWMAAAAVVLVVAQGGFHGAIFGQLSHVLAPGWHRVAQHAIGLLGKRLGGL